MTETWSLEHKHRPEKTLSRDRKWLENDPVVDGDKLSLTRHYAVDGHWECVSVRSYKLKHIIGIRSDYSDTSIGLGSSD